MHNVIYKDLSRVSVDVEGVNNLLRTLSVSNPEFTKAVKSALRRSAAVVRKSVRAGLANISSDKEKQRGVSYKVYRNASGAQVNIYTAFHLDRDRKKRLFIVRWLEEGTKEGIGKNGKKHGATPAKPFFNASVQRSRQEAESILSENIKKYISIVTSKRK